MRKGDSDKNIDKDKLVFWKRAGRRPGLQNTSEASDDKRGIRREKETQTRTQTETSLCFEKELTEGQLYRIQEKHR